MKQTFQARRGFLKTAAVTGLALSGPAHALAAARKAAAAGDPWRQADAIANRLAHHVKFRDVDYVVTDFGAAPCKLVPVQAWVSFEDQATLQTPAPGAQDCYAAFKAAIEKCHADGGGRVVIPRGDWFCAGPIVLLSNVNVHLAPAPTSTSATTRPIMRSTATSIAGRTASWSCRAGRATTA